MYFQVKIKLALVRNVWELAKKVQIIRFWNHQLKKFSIPQFENEIGEW